MDLVRIYRFWIYYLYQLVGYISRFVICLVVVYKMVTHAHIGVVK